MQTAAPYISSRVPLSRSSQVPPKPNNSLSSDFADILSTTSGADKLPRSNGAGSEPKQVVVLGMTASLTGEWDLSEAKGTPVWELPDAEYQDWLSRNQAYLAAKQKIIEHRHTNLKTSPGAADHPDYKPYAKVVVAGQMIAEIANNGFVITSGSNSKELMDLLSQDLGKESGPQYAQARADLIATHLGGHVVLADTALSQHQFDQMDRPHLFERDVDLDAMKRDPGFTLLQRELDQFKEMQKKRSEYIRRQPERRPDESSAIEPATETEA